jgi:hypothetical protein
MKCKSGVKFLGVHPQIFVAIYVADEVYKNVTNKEVTVTSCNDSLHSRTSLHYTGYAVDLRINDVAEDLWETLRTEIAKRLTDEYDVLLESNHIHIEYQPKGG